MINRSGNRRHARPVAGINCEIGERRARLGTTGDLICSVVKNVRHWLSIIRGGEKDHKDVDKGRAVKKDVVCLENENERVGGVGVR
jgi:hypothetical protein